MKALWQPASLEGESMEGWCPTIFRRRPPTEQTTEKFQQSGFL
jgi:hypothetical protein